MKRIPYLNTLLNFPGILVMKYILALPFLLVYFLVAVYLRLTRSMKPQAKPRILWGTQAIGGTQYYSRACQKMGYQSNTLMYASFHSNRPEDFDFYPWTILPRILNLPFLYKYLCFLWAFPRYEVFFHNFNGGLLYRTALERIEVHLWHLAGGKIVVYPYGGDAQVISRIKEPFYKHTMLMHYPELGKCEEETVRRLNHFARHADFIFTSVEHVDYLPYWDLMLMQMSAIDTDKISAGHFEPGELRQKYPDKTIIFHAANHRHVKGTDQLISACEELKAEGRDDFELVVYDRRSNQELLQAIYDADIVADQFVIGLYAMFALEAMSLGKPILCYFRPDLYDLFYHYSWAKECPILYTRRDQIKEHITWLLNHPEEQVARGKDSRRFVEKFHSLEAMGTVYDAIIRKVWFGSDDLQQVMKSQNRTLYR